MQRLREENKLINIKKCSFVRDEIVYMGFVILAHGLKIDPKMVSAIIEWPTPESIAEVRSFHKLASFYQKFIRNFSSVYIPVTETMRGDRKDFKWTKAAHRSFQLLKQKMTEQPVLALPDFTKVFYVDCDASGNAIEPVSETMNDAKRSYSVYDQKNFAIVQALKKWRHYLLPMEFVLYTDHEALQYLNSPGKFNQRHMRWVEFLQSYTVEFHPQTNRQR